MIFMHINGYICGMQSLIYVYIHKLSIRKVYVHVDIYIYMQVETEREHTP